MATKPKQNDEAPNEIFAAAPIENSAPAAALEVKYKEVWLCVRPSKLDAQKFDVLSKVDGVEKAVESNEVYNVALGAVGKLARKMVLACRNEMEFIP